MTSSCVRDVGIGQQGSVISRKVLGIKVKTIAVSQVTSMVCVYLSCQDMMLVRQISAKVMIR